MSAEAGAVKAKAPTPKVSIALSARKEEEGEAVTRPLQFSLITRLFSYTRPYARKRNLLFGSVILRSIQLPALVWMVSAIIRGPIAEGDIGKTLWSVGGFGLFALFTEACHHYRSRYALELGEAVVHDLRDAIFHHLQRMPLSFYNRTKLGRIISRVTSDVEILRQGVQNVLFVSMVQLGQMLLAGGLMLLYDWVLFLVLLGLVPILWGINRYFRKRLSDATRAVQASFSQVTANLAESVNGIRVTQGFVRQDVNYHFFRNLVQHHGHSNLTLAKTAAVFLPLLEFNSQIFIATLLIFGGHRVLDPSVGMDVGVLITFFFLANLFFSPIRILGNQFNNALLAMAGAERVFRLLDTKPEWEDDPAATDLGPVAGQVEFRRIGFAYDPGRPVLTDINFTVQPGQSVALVGHTGSGKSSIVSLLSKFYLPTEGDILIDGREIRSIRSESLHRKMGMVQQSNFLFSGTVLENILFAKPEATREDVMAAIRQLDCLDLIEKLSSGLDTEVGEKGAAVSLGQRQLICFARALLADPAVLILDEATSSIDALTETRLQNALFKLLKGRTSFLIAHRLSTIRHCDQVFVMRDGRIVERGTHLELIAQGGYYADLYRQFNDAQTA
jgi:ATP-binding cassette, subfamily B, bacterial